MNTFDEILNGESTAPKQPEEAFDKEAWAAKKKQQREDVFSLADETAEKILSGEIPLQSYLDIQGRLPRYTVTNAMLITAQKPSATRLGDYDAWKRRGGFVKKGQEGILILEPSNEYRRTDGTVGVSYNVKRVYDISQTTVRRTVEPLPEGKVLLRTLTGASPVKIAVVEMLPNGGGAFFDAQQRLISVKQGMGMEDIVKSLSMEIAHAELSAGDVTYDRGKYAFEAYCVSYLICQKYGIDAAGYNIEHIPDSLDVADRARLHELLGSIRNTYKDITERVDHAISRSSKPREQEEVR